MRRRTLIVGLVGAVASGKSTVAAFFEQLGADTIDADAIAHEVVDRAPVRRALAGAFGPGVIAGGRVDREALAGRAFRTRAAVRRLNAIVHPHVTREIRARVRKARGVLVVDAALLLEAGAETMCDVVVFVDAPRRLRERRAAARGWAAGELRRRERLQWSAARKKARADFVVDNGGPRAATQRQVERIYREFVRAGQQRGLSHGR